MNEAKIGGRFEHEGIVVCGPDAEGDVNITVDEHEGYQANIWLKQSDVRDLIAALEAAVR